MPRWTITVDEETDRTIRTLIARNGGKKGDLSRFVTTAARQAAFWEAVDDAREQTANVDPTELEILIDEALADVRGGRDDAPRP